MEETAINIRLAQFADLDKLMQIFEVARRFMQATGNPNQWINGYPQRELISREIEEGHCYVMEKTSREGEVQPHLFGTFCYIEGEDPNYARIEQGEWLNDAPYAVIHRLASDGTGKGVFDTCLDWAEGRCANLRVDTHADNKVMQHLLEKRGFHRCGIIYVANGTPRIAFQRVR